MSAESEPGPDYDTAGWIIASRYRRLALEELAEQPATPSTIEARTGVDIAHISRALQPLRDRGLVELLVPDDRKKGRIYGITGEGEAVLETVRDLGGGDGV